MGSNKAKFEPPIHGPRVPEVGLNDVKVLTWITFWNESIPTPNTFPDIHRKVVSETKSSNRLVTWLTCKWRPEPSCPQAVVGGWNFPSARGLFEATLPGGRGRRPWARGICPPSARCSPVRSPRGWNGSNLSSSRTWRARGLPRPSVPTSLLARATPYTPPTGIPKTPASRSPFLSRARRQLNSNAARERPLRSSPLVGPNGRVACLYGSIVSHSATSICEQRNPFQSPCDPLLTVPVPRSLSTERTPSVGNSMPSASNGPLPRQLGARPSPSRDGKVACPGPGGRGSWRSSLPLRALPSDRVSLAPTCSKGVCDGTPVPQHHR